jgi:ClpP class serine protease
MTMQRPVRRLTSDLYNKPHLISAEAFSAITSYLELRNAGMLAQVETVSADLDKSAQVGKIGLINIHGSLTNKPVESLCGATGTSYAGLTSQMSELIEAGCKTVVFDISSGGGEAFNCFQTADAIRQMADENEVYLISYVQDCAASAAYALCVMSDEVVCHPQGQVGSIGVLIALMNNSKALEKAGLTRTFVTAGANKIPFDANGDFRDEFIESLQEQVNELYGEFVAHVSKYTGLSVEEIKATEASMFRANKAMELGLINSIMTNEAFAEYLINRNKE